MLDPRPLPDDLATTRASLHRVAAHVLARARHAATGRLDLMPTPGGFGTPAFGPHHSVLRVSGGALVSERTLPEGAVTSSTVLDGASLGEVAEWAGLSLDAGFTVGHSTPPLEPVHEALQVDARSALLLGEWFMFTGALLDALVALHPDGDADRVRLWPEHFDLGVSLDAAPTARVTVGASPGDDTVDEPYVYVAPWGDERPAGVDWNAPFGAALGYAAIVASDDPTRAVMRFWRSALEGFRR